MVSGLHRICYLSIIYVPIFHGVETNSSRFLRKHGKNLFVRLIHTKCYIRL